MSYYAYFIFFGFFSRLERECDEYGDDRHEEIGIKTIIIPANLFLGALAPMAPSVERGPPGMMVVVKREEASGTFL
jgi:hypothetical protein